jgi:hypothetical protein
MKHLVLSALVWSVVLDLLICLLGEGELVLMSRHCILKAYGGVKLNLHIFLPSIMFEGLVLPLRDHVSNYWPEIAYVTKVSGCDLFFPHPVQVIVDKSLKLHNPYSYKSVQ